MIVHDNGAATDLYISIGAPGFNISVENLFENGAKGIYHTTVPTSGCPASWRLISKPSNGWPVGTGSGIPHYRSGGD